MQTFLNSQPWPWQLTVPFEYIFFNFLECVIFLYLNIILWNLTFLKVTRPVYSDYKRETTFKKPATGLFPTKESLGRRYESYFFYLNQKINPLIPIYVKIQIYTKVISSRINSHTWRIFNVTIGDSSNCSLQNEKFILRINRAFKLIWHVMTLST